MLTQDEIRKKLKDANIRKVSRACGLSNQTVSRLMRGGGIRLDSMEKLSAYLEKSSNESKT